MDYHCSTLFLSVVIRYTVFRSAHPSSSDSLWLSSEAVPPIGFILSLASLLSPNHFAMSCINKRGESVEDKIKKLDVELCKYREQIQKTRSGPVQQALKARAMRLLKQKKMYEGQRDMLYNQTFNLDQVSFTAEGYICELVCHGDLRLTLSRNKLNGTIPVSLTGLPNLINLLLDSNNLNGQIPQTLFQIPKYKKQLELWCWSTSPLCTEVVRSGDSSKPKTGIIAGVVAGVTVLLFGILVFLFCRDRHKGYKRDVFVDVAGWFVDVAAVPPQISLVCFVLWFV
ncbi:hypothetical protein YC2023_082141 [Brassica napus]